MTRIVRISRKIAVALIWVVLAVLILGLPRLSQTSAHGGGTPQISNEAAGPYWFTVWTSPDPARVGGIHVTIAVASVDDNAPILDAEIMVEVFSFDSPSLPIISQATREGSANKFFYEVDFELSTVGRHLVTVTSDGHKGSGMVKFDLEVLPASKINQAHILFSGLAIAAVLAIRVWVRKHAKHSASPPYG